MTLTSANPLEASFFADPIETRTLVRGPAPDIAGLAKGSSEWWLAKLLRDCQLRNVRLAELRSYYLGTNETWSLADRAHRDTFGRRFMNLRANYAQPVVEVPEQRMRVVGFDLFGDDAGADLAETIWLENSLEARSSDAHLDLLSTGICPILVDPWREVVAGVPLITKEDPLGVIVAHDPADPRSRLAALKWWDEDDGRRTAILYLPDRIEWYRTDGKLYDSGKPPVWVRLEGIGGPNPLGVVPIVELRNAPRARAEHEGIIDQLRLYAMTLYQMATASHYTAYRQKWATGVSEDEEGAEVDADGNPISSSPARASAGADQVATAELPEARFGTFEQSDMAPFVTQLREIKADIATISHTPHRLLIPGPTSVPPSGESVRLEDLPLTQKIERKFTTVGNGWETVMRLAFLARGDEIRARRMDLQTVWADPEPHTFSELMDGLSKAQGIGVPQERILRQFGMTPREIRQWKKTPTPAVTEGGPDA